MFHGLDESSVIQSWREQARAEGRAQALADGLAPNWDEERKKGRLEAIRSVLLNIGTIKLGPPTPEIVAIVESIDDEDRLQALLSRLILPARWDVLLGVIKDA